jgi:acetyltransferase-like isoleucine patch superfamily enzyme
VVDQDVPPFTIVAGNPARIIRKLDPDSPGGVDTSPRSPG